MKFALLCLLFFCPILEAKQTSIEKYHGHELVLYWRPGCPYCDDVIDYMKEHTIPVQLRNIQNAQYRKELIQIGGRQQVPCLTIDGKPMYESKCILRWLQNQNT